MKKKIVIMLVLLSILVIGISSAIAADDFTVSSGGITVDAHVDGFTSGDTWVIDRSGTVLTSSESSIAVEDLTGTNSGWIFTVNATDFTESTGTVPDPTVNGETLAINVDVEDWLSMILKDSTDTAIVAQNIPAVDGTDVVSANYTVNDTISGSGNLDVLEIEPGYGAGLFNFNIDYQITLDDWLPDGTTITSSAASGLFSSGSPVTVNNATQQFQIFAGTYETTITYSIASNPA